MTDRDKDTIRALLAKAALELSAQQAWSDISLRDLCLEAQVSLSECASHAITKVHIEAELDQRLDQAMLEVPETEADQTVRDRLFDVLMGRYDAFEDQRAAYASILKAGQRDAVSMAARRVRRVRSAAWALEAAGVSTSDASGIGAALGLAAIIKHVDGIWLSDDVDLAKTMAQLDKKLRESEERMTRIRQFSTFASGFGRKSRQKADESPPPATHETDRSLH